MKARTISRILSCLALFASSLLTYSARPAAAQTEDFSHRYVLFLGGVNSTSSGEGEPINDDFSVIETKLEDQGFNENNFVYFSYGAAYGAAYGSQYCLGWAYPLDTPAKPCKDLSPGTQSQPDLNGLSINPLYSEEATHLPIEQQSQALDWLIDQIVRADNSDQTQIDLVGFSLGGVVASHWAATLAVDSPNRKHVRSLVLLNSPVGGFALFKTSHNCDLDAFCVLLQWVIRGMMFGDSLFDQLQSDPAPGSIVPVLRKAPLVLPVTSIQSTNDYLVNDLGLRTCSQLYLIPLSPLYILPCVGEESGVIGQGAQSWRPSIKLTRVTLGGRVVTTPLRVYEIQDFLTGNHNAALREREGSNSPADRAAQLVSEAIQSPPPMPQPQSPIFTSPTPNDGSVLGCAWPGQCPTPASDATPIPTTPPMPDSGDGMGWWGWGGCLMYGQCRTPASDATPIPTADPAAPPMPDFGGGIDWGCLMYRQCRTPVSDATPIPTADPAIPPMPDSGGGIDWGCLMYRQCPTPASDATPMPTADPAAPAIF